VNKTLRSVIFGLLALVLTALVAIVLIARFALAPAAGEWQATLGSGR
jgi:penicillin-binding protein 1A